MPDRVGARSNVALERVGGAAYGEDAFHYFVAVECARARRSKQPVRLLFASLEPFPGQPVALGSASAARLFKGLTLALRGTDVMGWYRQDRVAGAVLSAHGDGSTSGIDGTAIEQRVGSRLRQCLPSRVARALRVHVMELGPRRIRKG